MCTQHEIIEGWLESHDKAAMVEVAKQVINFNSSVSGVSPRVCNQQHY